MWQSVVEINWFFDCWTYSTAIIKTGRVYQTQLVNILLLRSIIHIVYFRSNYMFRPFFPWPSSSWSYILFEATIQYAILSYIFLSNNIFASCVWLNLPVSMTVCSRMGMAHLKDTVVPSCSGSSCLLRILDPAVPSCEDLRSHCSVQYLVAATSKTWPCSPVKNQLAFSATEANSWFLVRSNLRRCDAQRRDYWQTQKSQRRNRAITRLCQIIFRDCSQRMSLLKWWVPSHLEIFQ